MSIVILDAMKGGSNISEILKEKLSEAGEEFICYELKDMSILPCRSCGACGFKSPGKCVVKDDSDEMLRAIVKSNMIIMLTPISFGGYSATLKKAVDKFMTLGLPSFMVKKGRLLHPPRYGSIPIAAIGINQGVSSEQEASFRKLVENNGWNMDSPYWAFVLNAASDIGVIEQEISKLLEEVC